jgi:hypothetical protein
MNRAFSPTHLLIVRFRICQKASLWVNSSLLKIIVSGNINLKNLNSSYPSILWHPLLKGARGNSVFSFVMIFVWLIFTGEKLAL